MWRIVLALLGSLMLAACGTTSVEQQTLTAHDAYMATALNNIHQTATSQAERLQITLESAEQRIERISTQGGQMIATLEERGFTINQTPEPLTPTPNLNNPNPTRPPLIGVNNLATSNPNASPTPVRVTPFQTATPIPKATSAIVADVPQILREIVLASSVGNDDCAINPTNTFTPQTEEIYIVAHAVELPDGTTLTTRWLRGTDELVVFDYTYDFVEDACVWFFADQTDFEFTPGSYSIVIEVNGLTFGEPVPFTISDQ